MGSRGTSSSQSRAAQGVAQAAAGASEQDAVSADMFDYSNSGTITDGTTVARARLEAIAGRPVTDDEIRALAGATGRGDVFILPTIQGVHDAVRIKVDDADYNMMRKIWRDGQGNLQMENEYFIATKPGGGLGTRVFAKQVDAAAKFGVSEIAVHAARDTGFNGYYTWARLGYKLEVNPSRTKSAGNEQYQRDFKGVRDTHQLFSRSGGAAWWKEHGHDTTGSFDLSAGSTSRRVLDSYLSEKGIRV